MLKAGNSQTLSVTFTPTDTADYNTATKTVSINVQKATPTITWANPADLVYGTALGSTQLDATASVPGSFVYTPAAGAVLNLGSGQTLSAAFTPTDATDYAAASKTASINVMLVGSVVVAEASTPKDGKFEPTDALKITWAENSPNGIVSQMLQIDGSPVASIGGPYGGLYYSGQIGKLGLGSHSYKITVTDTQRVTSSTSGTFTVVPNPPPSISGVVVTAVASGHALDSSESLKMTWAATSSLGITAQSVTVDGTPITPIGGPYGGLYYRCVIGMRSAGTHTYVISATDAAGTFSSTGTFTVTASAAPRRRSPPLWWPRPPRRRTACSNRAIR